MKSKIVITLLSFTSLLSADQYIESSEPQISHEHLIATLSKYNNHPKGWSPLNYAIEEQDYASALILIEYTADINKVDAEFDALIRLLVKARQNPNKKISDLQIQVIRKLIKFRINILCDVYAQNALELAIFLKNHEIIAILCDAGADLNHKHHRWNLIYAIQQMRDEEIVNLLLIHGANPNATDLCSVNSSKSALGEAIEMYNASQQPYEKPEQFIERRRKMFDIINLLLSYGAKV